MTVPTFAYSGEAARQTTLDAHRLVLRLALSAGHIFAWLCIFAGLYYGGRSFETALISVSVLFIISQLVALFVTPLAGAVLRHGIRRSLIYGTLASLCAFACASLMFLNIDGIVAGFIVSFAICTGLHRALYWIPYQTARAHTLHATSLPVEILISLMPLAAGVIIEAPAYGPAFLFAGVCVLIGISLLLVSRFPESFERFEWNYVDTWRALWSPFNRESLRLAFFDGFQGITLLFIWPLAAFVIVGQSFTALGLILSITLLCALIGRKIARNTFRSLRLEKSLPVAASILFGSWLLRLAAATPVAVLIADIVYHSGTSPKRFSIDVAVFDQVADGGHFVDEDTALKEMGMALGRIAALVFLVVCAVSISAPAALALCIIVAGVSAVFSLVIARGLAKAV